MKDFSMIASAENKIRDLRLCACGYQECEPYFSWGPGMRPYYLIFYVLGGAGTITAGETTRVLKAGEGFISDPDAQVSYKADGTDPWTCIWVGFDGGAAGEVARGLGLGDGTCTFSGGDGEDLRETVLSMLRHNSASSADEYYLLSGLYEFIAELSEQVERAQPEKKEDNYYVRKAAEYIRTHYSDNLKVSDLADYTGISRGYLYALFMQQLGISPQEYLASYRLTRAAEMLKNTGYSVESIATSCGYRDPVVFSKAFKKMHGLSPLKYRHQRKE